MITPQDVLDFWFQNPIARNDKVWWGGGPELDARIRDHFGEAVEQALQGELDHWAGNPESAVALIILLDQFCRNIHRGTGKAFAGDPKAQTVARHLVDSGKDKTLHPLQRIFAYMPFEHAEDLAMQNRCVELFEQLEANAPAQLKEYLSGNTTYARDHQEIIARFGRFPHRNQALGRPSTEEEEAYLTSGGRRFGQ